MKNPDHVRELIEAYLMEGLQGEDRRRFEAHIGECPACATALEEAISTDHSMKELFASVQPKPGLEDRIIRSLRRAPAPRISIHPMVRRLATGIAAVALMGALGYVVQNKLLLENTKESPRAALIDDSAKQFGSAEVTFKTSDVEFGLQESKTRSTTSTPEEMASLRSRDLLAKLDSGKDFRYAPDQRGENRRDGWASKAPPPASKDDHSESPRDEDRKKAREYSNGYYADKPSDLASRKAEFDKLAAGEKEREPRKPDSPAAGGTVNQKDQKSLKDGEYSYRDNTNGDKLRSANFFQPGILTTGSTNNPEEAKEPDADPKSGPKAQDPVKPKQEPPKQEPIQRKIIRNGEMEFEVESFDSAFMQITKIVNEDGGFVATTNSEKLPNGKVRGTIIVRVPPDRLDVLVLKLRALGELKSQRITSQDVTKAYTDTESELRAARAMEERLLEIIKSGKGEIKDLLEAEKQLGVWREKIEKLEGEIRYYNNLISLSTLSIELYEKEIRSPQGASEQERVTMGLEIEDVEKSYNEALKAIGEKKGRVTKSELKKYDGNQLGATILCEVPAGAPAGELIDRLKQLGRVARMDIDRAQTTQGGVGRPEGVKVERKDTLFAISIYNLANVQARVTVHLNLACSGVESTYKSILARIEEAGGRVIASNMNTQKAEQTSASIQFEIPSGKADKFQVDLRAMGELMRLQETENTDTNNVTKAKRMFDVQLFSIAMIQPRESTTLQFAAKSVPEAFRAILEAVQKLEGHVMASNLDERDKYNVVGTISFEVRRTDQAEIEKTLKEWGDVYSRLVSRAAEGENVVNSKVRLDLSIINVDRLDPRETTTVGIEVAEVDKLFGEIQALAAGAGGRTVESHLTRERSGRIVGKVVIDVPLAKGNDLLSKIKDMGIVRVIEASKNQQVPEGPLARARIDVTLANAEMIVPNDQGLGSTLRDGLSTSAKGLLQSLNFIVIGLLFVGPWALILWGIWKIIKRARAKPTQA